MRSNRKTYGFDYKAIAEPHFLDVASATLVDRVTGYRYACVSSDLGAPDNIAKPLLSAMVRLYDGMSKGRMFTAWGYVKRFCEYLAAEGNCSTLSEIDRTTFEGYRLYLRRATATGQIRTRTAWARFTLAQNVVAEALRVRGISLQTLDNAFPGVSRDSRPTARVSGNELQRILAAAKREVLMVWSDFVTPVADDAPEAKTVAYLRAHYGGIMRPGTYHRDAQLAQLVKNVTSTSSIARKLHAIRDSLLPYVILIGYSTAANISSLMDMQRDCLTPGLLPESFEIRWYKHRAQSEQIVIRSGAARFSAPALIKQVLDLTAPLLPHVTESEKNLLFIVPASSNSVRIGKVTQEMWAAALRAFLERNGLRDSNGEPLKFTFEMLRPSVLAESYRQTKNIMAVHRFANHRYLETTVRYVVDRVTDTMHDAAIVRAQDGYYKTISAKRVQIVEKSRPLKKAAAAGVSNDCANVLREDGRGNCPAWLWPLNDPGFIVPQDPSYLAQLIRLRRGIEESRTLMRVGAFEERYASLLATVTDILRRFPEDILKSAEEYASALTPLSLLADE